MLVASVDVMGGRAVQLERGESLKIDAGDPLEVAERLAVVGEIAVIDIDAARGEGANASVIREIVRRHACRVGGGIRDYDAAAGWLDAGAEKVIIGTAAEPSLLRRLPRDRVIVALDERSGRVADSGWRRVTDHTVQDRIRALRACAGGFLITFIEGEGCLGGLPRERLESLVGAAGDARVTFAGGVKDGTDIAYADGVGADAQVGMAIYNGDLDIADAFASVLTSDRPDGLWPTVVTDESGVALGLAYSSAESLRIAVRERAGVYFSRSRGSLWRKGATSGARQQLVRVDVDCDRDALRFTVRQEGSGFCHTGARSCFGDDRGLGAIARHVSSRVEEAPKGSYTARLLSDGALLREKLLEEAGELADASSEADVVWEAADVLYFTLVRMARSGVELSRVESELARRSLKITRRDTGE